MSYWSWWPTTILIMTTSPNSARPFHVYIYRKPDRQKYTRWPITWHRPKRKTKSPSISRKTRLAAVYPQSFRLEAVKTALDDAYFRDAELCDVRDELVHLTFSRTTCHQLMTRTGNKPWKFASKLSNQVDPGTGSVKFVCISFSDLSSIDRSWWTMNIPHRVLMKLNSARGEGQKQAEITVFAGT